MKTIEINRQITNAKALLDSLKARGFIAINVGSVKGKTWVWLADTEKKDPTSFVMSWDGSVKRAEPVKEPVSIALPKETKSSDPIKPKEKPEAGVLLKESKGIPESMEKKGLFSKISGGLKKMFGKPAKAAPQVPWWDQKAE